MSELKTEIRNYYSNAADPVTATEAIAGPGRLMDVQERPLRYRRTLAFVGAAMTLVAGVGLAAVLLLPGDSDIAGEMRPADTLQVAPTTVQTVTPTTPVAPATEQVVPTTLAAPIVQEPMTWSRLPFDGWVSAVVNSGSGLIAAGTSSDGSAALWTSQDGANWTPEPLDEATFGGYGIIDMVATSDGYAAIGGDQTTELVAWTSPDGLTWQRVSVEGVAPEDIERLNITAMTAGPSGLVVVGFTTRVDEPWMLEDHVVIHSPDGTVWQRADTTGLPLGGMKDVAAGGPGYVAVGIDWSRTGTPGVWTSPDGLSWTLIDRVNIERIPDLPSGSIHEMESLTVSEDGRLYAQGSGAVWASDDGTGWSFLGSYSGEPEDGFRSAWAGWANAAVASADRILLAGALEFRNEGQPDRAAAWASEDGGATWKRMSQPHDVFGDTGESEMRTLTEIDGTYVAFGTWQGEPTVWVGTWNEDDGS